MVNGWQVWCVIQTFCWFCVRRNNITASISKAAEDIQDVKSIRRKIVIFTQAITRKMTAATKILNETFF